MSEASAVQRPMLHYARRIGWDYLKPGEAVQRRGGEAGLYLRDVLAAQLQRLNPGLVDATRAAEITRLLDLLRPTIEGNRDAFLWLQGKQSIFVLEERRERNVRLIDFEQIEHNVFHVTDEWPYQGTVHRTRADVVFLVNGIPVAIAETKAAAKPNGLAEGIEQVRRYHRETPELLIAPQVFGVTELLNFFYGATWVANRKNIFNWKEVAPGDYEAKVTVFFDRRRFLRLLRDYILFLTKDDELSKVILRQHQVRAVEKVLQRVGEGEKRRGLVWHTQGSGKTLTMITIAARLLAAPGGDKPMIIMLVDRNELESQMFRNITSYGIGGFRVAGSKPELREILGSDYRGLVLSMIHKFDDLPGNLNPRKSVIVLVDEAHRTTGGDLGNYLMGALPNAAYIGFTGTPIDTIAKGQGTFKVFGRDDERGYLDKYSIAESIEDGTTVRLNYALAPSDLRVEKDVLEREFLGLAETEGISDIEELNGVLDRAVELKELMKNAGRMDRIAAYVARHYQENVAPLGFKAFLVAVDREACALYKQALDRYLPPDWSEVVYSSAHNDPALLKRYYLDEDQEKAVRRDFRKKDKLPRLLIVTEKLLTGFDAPVLYCMYLDKPMRDHVLLQAIARVNRPYEDEDGRTKPCGFVIDFVGIFETLERALSFDSDTVTSVIQNIDTLKQLFAAWMTERAAPYLPLAGGWDDKAKERAIAHFEDKTRRDEFFTFYRQLEALYDVLSPDAFLRPYLEQYQALGELYLLIRNAYSDRPYIDREITAKTRELLRQHADMRRLELPGAIHELGVAELEALKQSAVADTVKVLNLRKVLAATVRERAAAQPFLISIGERAAALAELYEDRHITTRQALEEFEKLARQAVRAEAERAQLDLDENSFAILVALRAIAGTIQPAMASAINAVFERYPEYQWDDQQRSKLRADLYRTLLPIVGRDRMIDAANTLLRLQRLQPNR